jgi:MFS family permease
LIIDLKLFVLVLAGIGYGCTYTPPIQALIEWFPDKRGLASGIVIAGFGSGALFFTPMMNLLCSKFATMPEYLGKSLETVTEGGKLFTKVGDSLQEVVYATSADLAKLCYSDLSEGFYLVGSGNTGVAGGLATMAGIYGAIVMTSAMLMKKPAPGYIPEGWTPPPVKVGGGMNVDINTVLKTPQFWLLFSTSTLLATGGMGLMSVAKPMISEVFTSSMPSVVTASFASSYLLVSCQQFFLINTNLAELRKLRNCEAISHGSK